MMTREEQLYLWLNQVTGHHAPLFRKIIAPFSSLEEAFALAKEKRTGAFLHVKEEYRERLFRLASEEVIEKTQERLIKSNIQAVTLVSEGYPTLLKEIAVAPTVLYVKGTLQSDLSLPIALVGKRKCSAYGARVAKELAASLAQRGATVVSGMAMGVDTMAAEGALSVDGSACLTVAVLGSGVDVVYPAENARLYDKIIERGAVISEFLPGTKPNRGNFPIRNRVISGLSRGVIIVEAGKRSGTSITAGYALEQGRDVFAVPGRITDAASEGPNGMIARGEAQLILSYEDVLLEYGIKTDAKPAPTVDYSGLTPVQQAIIAALQTGEKSVDDLCEMLALPASQVNSALTSLQFSGIMKQLPGRVYAL